MKSIGNLTIRLLRTALNAPCDASLPPDAIDEAVLQQIYAFSARHDLAHMAGDALRRLGLIGADKSADSFKKSQILAAYRCENILYETELLYQTLEKAGIPFIPLKGSVIRPFYPSPDMRTSCDIDVLVHPDNLECAIGVLADELSCTETGRGSHDVSLLSSRGIHIELHYTLIESDRAPEAVEILDSVWEHVSPEDGFTCRMRMHDDLFLFYHFVHMMKHFVDGGCGIRTFMDLWVLDHRSPTDMHACDAMLEKAGLLTFADACRRLAEVWFSDADPDDTTEAMAQFIYGGGVYGSVDNRVAVRQTKMGRAKYLMSRIILPYDSMKYQYPVLKKHRYLLPFCQVHRWTHLTSKDAAKRALHELNLTGNLTDEKQKNTVDLFAKLGLDDIN
ncbi:MAG: nucleotidyltransferase family protein [Clostridia bacterium]|nr:nucleotidyltransferase family protein [Clostridia bacterium]